MIIAKRPRRYETDWDGASERAGAQTTAALQRRNRLAWVDAARGWGDPTVLAPIAKLHVIANSSINTAHCGFG